MSVILFKENFITSSDSIPIVLYGLGKQTEEILSECEDKRIIGVLDGFRKEGTFCGKPIFALEDLKGQQVKIVICARKASEKIIYKRIQVFCNENNIQVFNVSGEDLLVHKQLKDDEYFMRTKRELLDKAALYDCVSFDIFDTFLIRKVPNRELLYKIVGELGNGPESFSMDRLSAEFELSGDGCPTLRQIYLKMKNDGKLSDEDANRLMAAELEVEKWNLIPRKETANILKEIVETGKKIYLVSDMYFPKTYLNEILDSCGITEFTDIFVSCEYGVSKTNGLFDLYKKIVQGTSYLHIGDSPEADGESANKCGIDSYIIKSPCDMAELTEFSNFAEKYSSKSDLCKLIFSGLFNSPFALEKSNGRVHIEDYKSVGYALLGPVMAGFVQWLIKTISNSEIEKICFISRDGYLIKQVYDMLTAETRMPSSVYLETSRQLSVVSSLENETDVQWAFSLPFSGTAQDRLEKQLGLDKENFLSLKDGESEYEYLKQHTDALLKHAKHIRENYKKYLNEIELPENRTAIFDFVSTGTCQTGLERVLGFPLQGLYFDRPENSDIRKNKMNIKAYVKDIMPELVLEQYFLIENWIKEPIASVKTVSENGQIVRSENVMETKQVEAIRAIQNGALSFCRDLKTLLQWHLDADLQEMALELLRYFNEDTLCLEEMPWPILDVFTGRKI